MAKTKKKPTPKAVKKAKPTAAPKAKKAVAKGKAPKPAAKPKKVEKPKKPLKKEAPVKVVAPKTKGKKGSKAEKSSKADVKPAAPMNMNLNIFPIVNQRPIAHKPAKSANQDDSKTRYSDEELKEFEVLINNKLAVARDEFRILKETLNRNNDEGTDSTSGGNTKVLEDGAETAEKENLSQQAARQQKYIANLENALVRIKNGTYGICSVTGKLISKERLIAVPHTTQSIEAKMMQKD